MEIWYLVAHTEQTSKWASMYRHATRPALALRLPCPTRPDVHLCASDHCTLRSNSPYRLIIRTVHCTQTLVYGSMLCVVCCWCCEVCGVTAVVYAPTCLSVCQVYVDSLSQELGLSTFDDSGLVVLLASMRSTLGGSSQMTVASLCMRSACAHTHTHIHTHTHHTTWCGVENLFRMTFQ